MNEKWADYIITAVRFDEDNTHIVGVERIRDTGKDYLDSPEYVTKKRVISDIKKGLTHITATWNGDYLESGQFVEIYTKEVDFIKTKSNRRLKDNLDELPEC